MDKKRFKNLILVKKKFERIAGFCEQKSKWVICSEKTNDSLIRSFVLSDLRDSLTVAFLTWVTWTIRSQSLICPE